MIKLKTEDQIQFMKRLGFLISADIPILNSLRILNRNNRSKKQKNILLGLIKEISLGRSLSYGFNKSGAFNQFSIHLTEIGETNGNLGKSLSYIALELEKKRKLRQKIQGALVYPMLIGAASIVISILLITLVFPKILPILSGLNGELPIATRILITLSTILRKYGFYILGAAAGGGGTFYFLFKKFSGYRYQVERAILNLPYLNQFSIYYQVSNFSRTIGLFLQSGLVLENGLKLLTKNSSNKVYQKVYFRLRRELLEGESLAVTMSRYSTLFPVLFTEMVEVGEMTGRLAEIFLYLSDFYADELAEKTKTLSGLLEPALMIFLGLIIGGVALSIIMPIYQITANLGH